ncbi:pullulanase 1, chloroplastic [Dorcoceras hygrometricum]|uniref:Pullulanase 1, chloroplastic n=1 Tax=Dorcoceras hygrometricum TaxID=472368 RepID=A0A2Z7A2V3_9LAMI|nr:pullulanase 1, chloroplastic [Dorcoceras hygrometricum]
MKICWLWCELKLLLADVAFSARKNKVVTRVSQHFGALTIRFSRCACEKRSADGLRAVDRYDDVGVTYPLLLVVFELYWLLLISRRAYARALRSGVV